MGMQGLFWTLKGPANRTLTCGTSITLCLQLNKERSGKDRLSIHPLVRSTSSGSKTSSCSHADQIPLQTQATPKMTETLYSCAYKASTS